MHTWKQSTVFHHFIIICILKLTNLWQVFLHNPKTNFILYFILISYERAVLKLDYPKTTKINTWKMFKTNPKLTSTNHKTHTTRYHMYTAHAPISTSTRSSYSPLTLFESSGLLTVLRRDFSLCLIVTHYYNGG